MLPKLHLPPFLSPHSVLFSQETIDCSPQLSPNGDIADRVLHILS